MKKEMLGPGGIMVELDTDEIYPDDPGAGTPALVWCPRRRFSATYACAMDTAEIGWGDYELTDSQLNWLKKIGPEIDKFLKW